MGPATAIKISARAHVKLAAVMATAAMNKALGLHITSVSLADRISTSTSQTQLNEGKQPKLVCLVLQITSFGSYGANLGRNPSRIHPPQESEVADHKFAGRGQSASANQQL
jgi:hypothetical protein